MPPVHSDNERRMTIATAQDRSVNGIAPESDRVVDRGFNETAFCVPEHDLQKNLSTQI